MTYAIVGILAVIIHIIINYDVMIGKNVNAFPARKDYRVFLFCVIGFHVTDALWGILYDHQLTAVLYADTVIYFAAMALSVMMWTIFVVRYLDDSSRFSALLLRGGQVLFAFLMLALVVNFFTPILFSLDAEGEYHAGLARYIALGVQMFMFLAVSANMIRVSFRTSGAARRRHITVGLFGFAMIIAILLQIFFPLMPYYSIGYLLGGCVLHTFVIEDVKEDYFRALNEAMGREARQKQELGATRRLAYTDPLTRVKNKSAYMEEEAQINLRIATAHASPFAIAVFDVNDLKRVNDTQGHEAGDRYIKDCSTMICHTFSHSPVFRIGGDEFVALLKGMDFENRHALMDGFNQAAESRIGTGRAVISAGMADYDFQGDHSLSDVFRRADKQMYRRKSDLKRRQSA